MTITTAHLNDSNSLKSHLENLDSTEFDQLRHVYQYRSLISLAKSTGRGNLLWGGLTLWFGLAGLEQSTLHVFQALIGAITLVVSLWSFTRPSGRGVRAFSWIFVICGIWNLFLTFRANFEGLSILVGILGLAQLWWAYQYHQTNQKLAASTLTAPSTSAEQTYDQIWNALAETNPKTDADFFEFQIGPNRWRGWLLGDLAVLGHKKRKVVYLSREADVAFYPHVKKLGKKKHFYVGIKLDDISAQGVIKQAAFDRYAQWKLRSNPLVSPEALQLTGSGKNDWLPFPYLHPIIRIPILIAGAVVLLLLIYTIVIFIQYS